MITKINIARTSTNGYPLKVASDLPDIDFGIKEKTANFDKQQVLFRVLEKANHIDMGYFFEMLTSVLFNGKINNKLYVKKKHLHKNDYGDFFPDVVNKKENIMIESKSVAMNNGSLNLYDSQMESYESHQFYDDTNLKIYWILFIHNVRKTRSFKGTKRAMFKILGKYTHAGIVLPFSIVHALWKNMWINTAMIYRYDKNHHAHGSYVLSRMIKKLVADPIAALGAVGLDRSEFLYHKTHIPEGVVINKQPVTPFPVIYIKDKDHGAWLYKFKTELDKTQKYKRSEHYKRPKPNERVPF